MGALRSLRTLQMNRDRGGVEYEDLKAGNGPIAARGCTVEVRYSLFLNRGERIQDEQLCSFRLGGRSVIPGLEYGVEGMRLQRTLGSGLYFIL